MRLGRSFSAVAILAVLICTVPVVSGQTLPEVARTNGGVAINVIDIDGPLPSMLDVVHDSDLVLHGQIVALRTLLNADQTQVETEYTIRAIDAVKDERRRQAMKTPGTVAPIIVRRAGGRLVTDDGMRLGTWVNIFPDDECFSLGEEVVVMLTYRSNEEVYHFSHGEFAAFRIRDGIVIPMTKSVVQRRKDLPTPIGAFLTELRRRLR